jgi:uncharacterized protein with FMN-binding domain
MKNRSLAALLTTSALTAATATAASAASTTHKYKGPIVDMRWGPVQATVYIKSKKIVKVSISTAPENERSTFIDQQAVPLLKDETLQAQSSTIDLISGATMTSEAFVESLQSVLLKAHFKAKS